MDYKREEDGEWKCIQDWRRKLLQNERLKDQRRMYSSAQQRFVWHAQTVTE
jgi:hypothetical protein